MSDDRFGDFEPEDAYDESDPIELKIAVLERVAESLRAPAAAADARTDTRRGDALRLVVNLERQSLHLGARVNALRDALGGR